MSDEEIFRAALIQLINTPNQLEYYEDYITKNELKSSKDIVLFFNNFKSYLLKNSEWDDQLEIIFKIILAKTDSIQEKNTDSPLFFVNQSKRIADDWIEQFIEEFENCFTGDSFAEKKKIQKYKTITEYDILIGLDAVKLNSLYLKYNNLNHPFINYKVSCSLYNLKNYSQGLPILYDGIKSIISYPNYYWNNEYAIEGATWMVGDLIYLLGNQNLLPQELKSKIIKLLKLLYLYMSRYIYMTKSNIKCIDFYANRAKTVKSYYKEFIGIFNLGVNPDIQYISDMHLAHVTGTKHGLPMLTKPFDQFYWESKKMYSHGSHIPNNSGGYNSIEDETFIQLVRKGEIRSIHLADRLFKEFENYELNFTNSEVDNIFTYLSDVKKDDYEVYGEKIRKKKL